MRSWSASAPGYHKDNGPARHNIDHDKPEEHLLARSRDGGLTWAVENPAAKGVLIPAGKVLHGVTPPRLKEKPWRHCPGGIDFTHPDFAPTARMTDTNAGPSRFYYSTDRGQNRCGIRNEWHTRTIRPFSDRFHAAHNAICLQRDRHGAFIVRQGRPVRPVKFPRSAPLAGAKRRPTAPQIGGRVVVVGDTTGGIRRVDGGGKGIEQPTEATLALAQSRLRSQAF